jgi:putative Mg2+ transporter-C (MgtC) family protein
VLVGALIGLDREIRNKPAGLRTIALVSLGSAIFVVTALDGATGDSASRVIQGIVTGVGFLGAGSIVHGRTEQSVHGLTTAASIWLASALGIACGLAYWPIVAAGCGFGVAVLVIEPFDHWFKGRAR